MLVAPNPGPEVLGAESALQGRMLASVQRVKEELSFKIPENRKQENSEQEIHKRSHKKMASMYELFTLQLVLQLLNDHMISRAHIFVLI